MATDHFADESLKGLRLAIFDLVAVSGMHFDQARERGVVFHMMSGHRARLGRHDRVGSIAADAEEVFADAAPASATRRGWLEPQSLG